MVRTLGIVAAAMILTASAYSQTAKHSPAQTAAYTPTANILIYTNSPTPNLQTGVAAAVDQNQYGQLIAGASVYTLNNGTYTNTNGGTYYSTAGSGTWSGSDYTLSSGIQYMNMAFDRAAPGATPAAYCAYVLPSNNNLYLTKSTNNGASWSGSPTLIANNAWCDQWGWLDNIAVDVSPLSQYQHRIYSVSIQEGSSFEEKVRVYYSTDGGNSFQSSTYDGKNDGVDALNVNSWDYIHGRNTTVIFNVSAYPGGDIATGPNGEVYVVWGGADHEIGPEERINFNKSTDGGFTFTGTGVITNSNSIVPNVNQIGATGPTDYESDYRIKKSTSNPLSVTSAPSIAVDQNNGYIYVVWADADPDPNNNNVPRNDVMIIRSTDGGSSWSNPAPITTAAGDQWAPRVSVGPDGVVQVLYWDSRNDPNYPNYTPPNNGSYSEVYLSRSVDNGQTFTDYEISDNHPGEILTDQYGYDRFGIATGYAGAIYPVWQDNRTGIYRAYSLGAGCCCLASYATVDQQLQVNGGWGPQTSIGHVYPNGGVINNWNFMQSIPPFGTGSNPANTTWTSFIPPQFDAFEAQYTYTFNGDQNAIPFPVGSTTQQQKYWDWSDDIKYVLGQYNNFQNNTMLNYHETAITTNSNINDMIAYCLPTFYDNMLLNCFTDDPGMPTQPNGLIMPPILGTNSVIGFKDPWLYESTKALNAVNQNIGENSSLPVHLLNSPFTPNANAITASDNNTSYKYNGVFLGQAPANKITSPYYSIYSPLVLNPNLTIKSAATPNIGDWFFYGYTTNTDPSGNVHYAVTENGANGETQPNSQAVVFKSDNANVRADYKEHLSTANDVTATATSYGTSNLPNTKGLPTNSERTIVFRGALTNIPGTITQNAVTYSDNKNNYTNSQTVMIYIDNHKLYFTSSFDGGQTWTNDQRIDVNTMDPHYANPISPFYNTPQPPDDIRPGYVGNASACVRSDGTIGVVYEDYTHIYVPNPYYPVTSENEPFLVLLEGTPSLSGLEGQYTWNNTGSAPPILYAATFNSTTVANAPNLNQYVVCGYRPVVAPRVVEGYNNVAGSYYKNKGWWISWAHTTPNPAGTAFSEQLNAGIYAAYTWNDVNNLEYVSMDPTNNVNNNNLINNSTGGGGIPSGDNPSISASYIDGYNLPVPTIAESGGGGASTQATFAPKISVYGAAEGSALHIAWNFNNKIYYTNVSTSMAAPNGPIMPSAIESPSAWGNAFATYFPGAKWLGPARNHGKPSLGLDDYSAPNPANNVVTTFEEPVVGWEVAQPPSIISGIISLTRQNQIFALNITGTITNLQAVAINRRGSPKSLFQNQPPWANRINPREFAEMWVVNKSQGYAIDHPTVTTFPSDGKWGAGYTTPGAPNFGFGKDLQTAITFHFYSPNFKDMTGMAYSYILNPLPNNVTSKPNTGVGAFPYQTVLYTPGLFGAPGVTVEPHFAYDPYEITPYSDPTNPAPAFGNSGLLTYKSNANNGAGLSINMYNYGFVPNGLAGSLGLGKELDAPADFGAVGTDYLASDITFDSSGEAGFVLGEVALNEGTDSVRQIQMHHIAPDILDTNGTIAPVTDISQSVRSMSFRLASGNSVTAGIYLLSDSTSIINMMNSHKTASIMVNVVDSASGNVLIPLYNIMLGGQEQQLNIPSIFPTFIYNGVSSNAAYVKMSVYITGSDSLYSISGLAIHALADSSTTFGKTFHPTNIFAMLPTDQLKIFPNPTASWSQFEYNIYQAGHVQVQVYDMLGRMVKQVVDKYEPNGHYALAFDTEELPSGYYKVNILVDGNLSSVGDMVVKK